MSYTLYRESPVPIWIVGQGKKPQIGDGPVLDLYRSLRPVDGVEWIAFRGARIELLPEVLATGVDATP
ncbi:hypothetical protein, partial [Mycobacterium sp. shizuoka-1]|uniref:hypothetical protein n=1 Tax=Mycobacterium sp. shizuoka-1 TaxID=2039281 RepID=UPI001E5CE646